ncbi:MULTISPECIES: cytochrome c oxidase subunit 4 [unclassified Diaminobutyricimonas]|uniref:aa3-type cytochrome oxidase subunit IV n=1 Tax=unclassified Diaminobutyricimonas TaxID=2643261 RepID=UPI0012F47BDE|nr:MULTISPECIES: cytochrome c oxidase subunit 4 [unclassified Diaminobutyricimonas]
MKANVVLYWVLCVFFVLVDVMYIIWALEYYDGQLEWAGAIALGLAAALAAFLAFYLGKVHRSQGGELPEDRVDANIDDGDPELGHFSPWSWWPITLAGAASLIMLGLAVGFWIIWIGVALTIVALVGWVYEYYRGSFAR